ncbi:hypothetical protein AMJ85_06730 [candidate division BRC1 bacterium SM23_51]|nr:MAG: hypothetical protein AMJ85_06730 [candidate division BRC1 bacterium SM23_51]
METPIGQVKEAGEATAQASNTFMDYLGAHWHQLLFLLILVAFVAYAFSYMRKRFPIVREFLVFLKERKLWWLTPIVVVFLLLALLIVTMEGSAILPFLYPL